MLNKNSKYKNRKTFELSEFSNSESKYRFRDPDVTYPNNHLNVLEWLQNPKTMLDEYHTVFEQEIKDFQFGREQEIFFLSSNKSSICSSAKVVEKNPFMQKNQKNIIDNYITNKDLYISRGKDSVVVVLGHNWTAGDGLIQKNIQIDLANQVDIMDMRLETIYASQVAQHFDSDLYLSAQVAESNNTDLIFSLPAILEFLQEKNYRTIKVIFEMDSADNCMVYSTLWNKKIINNRYAKFYGPYQDQKTIANNPNSSTPWAYFFWHMGVKRKDVYNNAWHIMDYWPHGFMTYEDYFRYYDLCILECFDAFCDQYTNVEGLCFKKNTHWQDTEFSSIKIIEKPWLKEILEYHGHNKDLTVCYNDLYLSDLQHYFIVSPFEVHKLENMLSRENGFLRDAEQKKKLILNILASINDDEHFDKGFPQRYCHKLWARYIIDNADWRM